MAAPRCAHPPEPRRCCRGSPAGRAADGRQSRLGAGQADAGWSGMTTEPRPARAVVLPADPEVPVTVETVDGSLPGLWTLLGGQPEVVSLGEGVRAVLWCHGYGKRERLPGNGRATRFVTGSCRGSHAATRSRERRSSSGSTTRASPRTSPTTCSERRSGSDRTRSVLLPSAAGAGGGSAGACVVLGRGRNGGHRGPGLGLARRTSGPRSSSSAAARVAGRWRGRASRGRGSIPRSSASCPGTGRADGRALCGGAGVRAGRTEVMGVLLVAVGARPALSEPSRDALGRQAPGRRGRVPAGRSSPVEAPWSQWQVIAMTPGGGGLDGDLTAGRGVAVGAGGVETASDGGAGARGPVRTVR